MNYFTKNKFLDSYWYGRRSYKKLYYFNGKGGDNSGLAKGCACATNSTCLNSNDICNCDSSVNTLEHYT